MGEVGKFHRVQGSSHGNLYSITRGAKEVPQGIWGPFLESPGNLVMDVSQQRQTFINFEY